MEYIVHNESLIYYVLRNSVTLKYLGRNENYMNGRVSEFYETSLSDSYKFDTVKDAEKVQKEYPDCVVRKVKVVDIGEV